jgi:hypothetical protein
VLARHVVHVWASLREDAIGIVEFDLVSVSGNWQAIEWYCQPPTPPHHAVSAGGGVALSRGY